MARTSGLFYTSSLQSHHQAHYRDTTWVTAAIRIFLTHRSDYIIMIEKIMSALLFGIQGSLLFDQNSTIQTYFPVTLSTYLILGKAKLTS